MPPLNIPSLNDQEKVMLYQYAFDENADAVIARAQTHPHEAEYKDSFGYCTLHILAWNKAPIEAIDAVYKAYSGAITARNNYGSTPFELAVREKAPQGVIEYLREADPSKRITEAEENYHSLRIHVEETKMRVCADHNDVVTQVTGVSRDVQNIRDKHRTDLGKVEGDIANLQRENRNLKIETKCLVSFVESLKEELNEIRSLAAEKENSRNHEVNELRNAFDTAMVKMKATLESENNEKINNFRQSLIKVVCSLDST
mmetsp:Transcript_11026/g.11130  ORF Transcript_11026/g.11130 Transcript_11026/m.11130 type:complete len:258 (-) Transcript_11026:482-1255(-)